MRDKRQWKANDFRSYHERRFVGAQEALKSRQTRRFAAVRQVQNVAVFAATN